MTFSERTWRYLATIMTVFVLLVLTTRIPTLAHASELHTPSAAREIQQSLQSSLSIIEKAKKELEAGKSSSDTIAALKAIGRAIEASSVTLDGDLRCREDMVSALGAKALQRHRDMVSSYQSTISQYLSLLDGLTPQSSKSTRRSTIKRLKALLDKMLYKSRRPILGLDKPPYRSLNYPARQPDTTTSNGPALQTGSRRTTLDNLKSYGEAPISKEVAELAQSLGWSPVAIYEYVKNNIETEWYYGCMKGAEQTLRQKSGNDCDQAALLSALLRASGFPTRYVRGTIMFFPDIEKLKNLTGLDNPTRIAQLFQRAGIPFRNYLCHGKVINLLVEHIWVEAQVPYGNYRGAIVDGSGVSWVALDTSIKPRDYKYNSPIDILSEFPLSGIRDDYLKSSGPATPIEFMRQRIRAYLSTRSEPASYEDLLITRTLPAEDMKVLPASLQFTVNNVIARYAELPDALNHEIRLTASRGPTTLFSVPINLKDISNKKTILSYEPETREDQEIINSHGGLDSTPAYLVRLRPVLKVNGERIVVGSDGLPMGVDLDFTIGILTPNGIDYNHTTQICGSPSAFAIVAQKVISPEPMPDEEKNAEQLLFERAIDYIDRWNKTEDELGSLLGMTLVSPAATVVNVGNQVEVTYLLDTPHEYQWRGVFIDAKFRVAPVQVAESVPDDRPKVFMQLSSVEASVQENRIFEDAFKVECVSAAKVLQIAHQQGMVPITIDKSNIAAILPNLHFYDNVIEDITNAVNRGMIVTIPETEISFHDWQGIVYIKEGPSTGEVGYMICGLINGGMTAWSADKWPGDYAWRLGNPYSEPSAHDPSSAESIQKITATDLQKGKVGMPLDQPFQVVVRDKKGMPVAGVPVTFSIKAGGGKFNDGSATTVVTSNPNGIAFANLVLGEKTSYNPAYIKEPGNVSAQKVGENLVGAALPSGTSIVKPFTALGFPQAPYRIAKYMGDGGSAKVLTFLGTIAASVEDKYENPISNLPMVFTVRPPTSTWKNPNVAHRDAGLVQRRDPCYDDYPTFGQCETEKPSITETTDDKGAAVGVILGGLPEGKYPVEVTSGNLSAVFNLKTDYCNETDDIVDAFFQLMLIYPRDERGLQINAGKVGDLISVKAKIYFFKEIELHEACPQSVQGYCIRDGDEFEILTEFDTCRGGANWDVDLPPQVFFGRQEGTPSGKGDGIYTATHKLTPGVNEVGVKVRACLERRFTTSGSCPCEYSAVLGDYQAEGKMLFYGVDIHVAPVPPIRVDLYGYATKDYQIQYTMEPAEFTPYTANVLIYRDGLPVASIPSRQTGNGSATISQGFQFDLGSNYEAEVVVNEATGVEIRSDRVPIVYLSEVEAGRLTLQRSYHLSRFDDSVPALEGGEHTDGYKVLDFHVAKPSTALVKLYDGESNEKGTIVCDTALGEGDFSFVVDYGTIRTALTGSLDSPYFYLVLKMTHADGSGTETKVYHGDLRERTDGKMLGQVMVHDVLIQDGSLNLTRQDMALKGRGPQLALTRSYNNQPSPEGFKPLGEGWAHSLDMKAKPLGFGAGGEGLLPHWVVSLRGTFFKESDVPPDPEWTLVQVNGGIFRKHNGTWYPDRGHHGTLEETAGGLTFTSKDGAHYRYTRLASTSSMSIQAIEDRNGNVMSFAYDEQGRLATVTDAVGRAFAFTYQGPPDSSFERLRKVSGPDGLEVAFTYNEHGYLESARRGERVETYEYALEDNNKDLRNLGYNLVKTVDTNGNSYHYEYFGPNEIHPNLANFVKALKSYDVVRKVQYPFSAEQYFDNNTALFTYDVATGNRRNVTDLNGKDTVYTLNYYGNPMRIEAPEGKVTAMTWSIDEGKSDNVMTSKTDGRGNTTTFEYDARGNITKETDAYNNTVTTAWNQKFSLPERRTDRNSVVATFQYDEANGNLLFKEDGDGKKTGYTYFTTGEPRTMTDPRGHTTTYEYDTWGNPARIIGPEESTGPIQSITALIHDIRGRKRSVTDPNGHTTQYTYDALDYPRQIIHPPITLYNLPSGSTNIQEFSHDPMGNLLSETNRNGLKTTYTYTVRNQVKTASKSTGGLKTLNYDGNGNLVFETDWKGKPTTHAYNGLNQRTSTTNRMGYTMFLAYDPEGNLTRVTDFEGRTTDYEYDKLSRQTDAWQPTLPGQDRGHAHNDYYNESDPKTNLKSVTDQEGHKTSYEYNGRYLPTKRTNALNDVFLWEYDDNGNLARETDEEANVTEHEYSNRNHRTATTRAGDTGNIQTRYRYDANGNRIEAIDPRNNATATAFDEWNWPFRVTNPDNYSVTTEHDGEGNKVKTTDGNGNTRVWRRDAQGRVMLAVDAEGFITTFAYDENDNVVSVKEPNDTVTTTTYDAEGRPAVTTETASSGKSRTKAVLARDKVGNPLWVRDYLGNVTTTHYNGLNLPERVHDPAPFSAQNTYTTYYKTGKTKSVTNRRGFTTTYEYDALKREKKVTDAKGQSVETAYDKVGNIKTVKDNRSIIKESFFDKLYRLIRVERDGIRLVTNEYDDTGNLIAVIDANGNHTEHTYNKRNLREVTTFTPTSSAPAPTTESRTYDGVGNLVTLANEENKVTTYTYDKENRQTSVEFAGEKTTKTYDKVGNLASVIKPKGNRRELSYDGFKLLASVVEDRYGLNLVTRFEYDSNGNLINQYDARNNRAAFGYDELNRKTHHVQYKSSGNLITQYTLYDEEGNLEEMTDPKGQVFSYDYDELNRQTDANFPPEATTPFYTITRIHTDFDPNNNPTSVTEYKTNHDNFTITDITTNHYDNFDRLFFTTRSQAADDTTQRELPITYAYDNNGNRTSISTPSASTTYTYDARNRLETATIASDTPNGLTTTYAYYPDGKKNTISHPNSTSAKYTYHLTNRIELITSTAPSGDTTVISGYAYLYDANGNRTSQTELQNGTTETTTYHYDSLDRLKDFTITSPSGGGGGAGTTARLTEYTFEAYNRKTERVTQNGTVIKSQTYLYDETDWLKRIEDQGKSIIYQYDDNGNLTAKSDTALPNQDTTFTYDSRNHLVQTTRGPPSTPAILGRYDYNAEGLRCRHRNSDRGDIDTTYDGHSIIEEHTASGNTLLAHYHHADTLLALDTGSLDTGTQGTKQYYHFDSLGSTTNLTTDTGSTQASYQLDPYGHLRSQSGSTLNRNIFTGHQHDLNTGLITMGVRTYDPDTARFLTQDTYLGDPTTPPSLHRYLYAYSNPTLYEDRNGDSATLTGAVAGFFWGFGQMSLEIGSDLWNGEYHSTKEYLGTWGQNVIGAAEIGASFDLAALSGGTAAAMGSGALGMAGFEALTLHGRGDSLEAFVNSQARAAVSGAILGGVLAEAAPVLEAAASRVGGAISKLPYGEQFLGNVGKTVEWAAEKASVLDAKVTAEFSREGLERTSQHVQQSLNKAVSKASPRGTVENVAGEEVTTVAKLPGAQKALPTQLERPALPAPETEVRELASKSKLTPSDYPNPDPPMDLPAVRYEPRTIEEVMRMREGKAPLPRQKGGDWIEGHHRQQFPAKEGGKIDELWKSTHRGPGQHTRHGQSSQLTPSQRSRELRGHYMRRGSEYMTGDGEGI